MKPSPTTGTYTPPKGGGYPGAEFVRPAPDEKSRFPDVVIVGAYKCGAEVLKRVLASHPAVRWVGGWVGRLVKY